MERQRQAESTLWLGVYFSSRKSTLIGTTVDFRMECGDCREGTSWPRCLRDLKLSTKNSIMYWIAYFSRYSASSLFGTKGDPMNTDLATGGPSYEHQTYHQL